MPPFQALYGRKCRSPLNWSEPGERVIFGPDLVTEAEEKVRVIQNHLKTAQSRQKSYSDKRRRPLEFEVGSWAYLRVSPMERCLQIQSKRKTSTPLYWTLQDNTAMWTRGISVGIATTSVINAQCVPRVSTQEMPSSSNRSHRDRSYTTRARFDLSRASNQDFGSERTSYPKKNDQILE